MGTLDWVRERDTGYGEVGCDFSTPFLCLATVGNAGGKLFEYMKMPFRLKHKKNLENFTQSSTQNQNREYGNKLILMVYAVRVISNQLNSPL